MKNYLLTKIFHHKFLKINKLHRFLLIILCVCNNALFSQQITYSFIKPSRIIDEVDTLNRFWIIDESIKYVDGIDTLNKFTFSSDSNCFSGYIKLKDNKILFLNLIDTLNHLKIQRINLKRNKVAKSDNFCGEGPLIKYKVISNKQKTIIKLYRDDNLLISHKPVIKQIVFSDKYEYPIELLFIEDGKEYKVYPVR